MFLKTALVISKYFLTFYGIKKMVKTANNDENLLPSAQLRTKNKCFGENAEKNLLSFYR